MENFYNDAFAHFNSIPVILNRQLFESTTNIPYKKNKNKRIQKKWIKRYGYRKQIDNKRVYVFGDKLVMHPKTLDIIKNTFSKEEKAELLSLVGGNKNE